MSKILKGNFETKRPVSAGPAKGMDLEEQFEREAIKRLGGSIAFVSKKNVMWDLKDEKNPKPKGKK